MTSTNAGDDPTTVIQGCKVIIVEDESFQALQTAQSLIELGAEVIGIATSIPAALAELSTKRFDVICLDVNMGGMLTVGMARSLKDMRVPIVFCTAYGSTISKFVDAPIVEKPISKEALAHALVEALRSTSNDNYPGKPRKWRFESL